MIYQCITKFLRFPREIVCVLWSMYSLSDRYLVPFATRFSSVRFLVVLLAWGFPLCNMPQKVCACYLPKATNGQVTPCKSIVMNGSEFFFDSKNLSRFHSALAEFPETMSIPLQLIVAILVKLGCRAFQKRTSLLKLILISQVKTIIQGKRIQVTGH